MLVPFPALKVEVVFGCSFTSIAVGHVLGDNCGWVLYLLPFQPLSSYDLCMFFFFLNGRVL